MARSVLAGETINYGSAGNIDNVFGQGGNGGTVAMWYQSTPNASESSTPLAKDSVASAWAFQGSRNLLAETGHHLHLTYDFATLDGDWTTAIDSITNGVDTAIGVVYDNNDTANDPVFFINGAVSATNSLLDPIGAAASDAADDLVSGLGVAPGMLLGWVIVDRGMELTTAEMNRHRWWGVAPGGPSTVDIWHPMWTDATANKGTATADMTPSAGVGMASIPKVERCWASCLGVGR